MEKVASLSITNMLEIIGVWLILKQQHLHFFISTINQKTSEIVHSKYQIFSKYNILLRKLSQVFLIGLPSEVLGRDSQFEDLLIRTGSEWLKGKGLNKVLGIYDLVYLTVG